MSEIERKITEKKNLLHKFPPQDFLFKYTAVSVAAATTVREEKSVRSSLEGENDQKL